MNTNLINALSYAVTQEKPLGQVILQVAFVYFLSRQCGEKGGGGFL